MTSKRTIVIGGVVVAAVTFGVFSPALSFEFVNWDDNLYVYQNPRLHPLTFQNIVWLFTHSYFLSWTPVALLSHALDLKIWGTNPFGHHLTSLLLHSANAVLVFWLALIFQSGPRNGENHPLKTGIDQNVPTEMVIGGVVAALLFSLHPLRVESVAWISDRKDLLCTFFMLLCTVLFISRRKKEDETPAGYAALLTLYALALGTKSVAAVLPGIFILIDMLLFRRKFLSGVKSQLPLIIPGIATVIVARIAAEGGEKNFLFVNKSGWEFLAYPFTTLLFYLRKTIIPVDLSPVYATDTFLPESVLVLLLAPALILAISIFCWMKYRRGNAFLAAGMGSVRTVSRPDDGGDLLRHTTGR